ncbi:MAG: long-chain fatty acid--CoA ligase [Methylotenera sp.]|nr:long-chain fatty acid--CoA ligase [Oligoflexia bacterium]
MATTVLHRLAQWAQETPDAPAQKYKAGGEWKTITAKQYIDRVHHLALFLESKGIQAGAVGAILSYNCMEWAQTELALLLLGAKMAGLYPNSTPKDIGYIMTHTAASVVTVQNKDYYKKLKGEKGDLPLPSSVKLVLVIDGDTTIAPGGADVVSFADALAEGKKLATAKSAQRKTVDQYVAQLDPRAGAFMIFTSGTTGNPKGAVLCHDNLTFTSDAIISRWKLPKVGTMFSFLPLCHVAEQLQSIGVAISRRYCVSYATKFENVSTELPEVSPTLLLCVPRLWEKMMEGVMSKVSRGTGIKKHLATWAFGVGERVAVSKFSGKIGNPLDQAQLKIADKLVLSKVREALGLGKANLLASGAAPLPAHVTRWFRIFGLEIYECYGSTETTGVTCVTEPGVDSAGTVGKPMPGFDFKLAEDGEILTKGRHVFLEYYKEKAATETALQDGWYHTGDLGEWTSKGLLRIRGRKKEIMKSSGGKMVAPAPIEDRLKVADIISQVCMVGDNRKYFSAIVTLSESTLVDLKNAAKSGKDSGDGVVTDPDILKKVGAQFEEVNKTLASFEQIKRFTILDREFSIEQGEMTPTLKMKRAVIETRFKPLIDQMYI